MPHEDRHEHEVELKLSGSVNVGVFGSIEHKVSISLPPGVQGQLDRIEARLVSIEKKIDDCCGPGEAVRLIVTVGKPTEQP